MTTQDRIDALYDDIKFRTRRRAIHAFYIGKDLHELKKLLPIGKFMEEVKRNTEMSQSTAESYMRIYTFCQGREEALEYLSLSFLHKICASNAPEQFRDFILFNAPRIVKSEDKALVKLMMKYKKNGGEIDKEEIENYLNEANEKDYLYQICLVLKDALNGINKSKARLEELKSDFIPCPLLKNAKLPYALIQIKSALSSAEKSLQALSPKCEKQID